MSGMILYGKKKKVITPVKYGALYNWYAANDIRNIVNVGWEVPTRAKWDTLIANEGGVNVTGGHLKEDGIEYWSADNADNYTLFNGRGSGIRTSNFLYFKEQCGFWTNEGYLQPDRWGYYYRLNHNNTLIDKLATLGLSGLSIRLIKTTTTLTQGQTGTYTGNDNKVYRTICIGTQEWLADNLNETKYRNGDVIPIVTVNGTWAALTTGARCSPNNDDSNL